MINIMSIENKLTYLDGTKDAIKQAIIGKGVSVTEADTFRSYATKIGEIQGGGSGGDCPKNTLDLTDGVSNTFKITNEIKGVILPSNMDNVTNMNGCFSSCTLLTSITLPDLPNVTDMYSCFRNCFNLTSITLPSSLPKVTTMDYCFQLCTSLTSITLPELPNVTNIDYCFDTCSKLTSITLLELPLVASMYNCFRYCKLLTSVTLPELPNVTSMSGCFSRCTSLQNLSIGNINPNITTLTNWYISACTLLTVDSLVNIMNALPTITNTRTCTIGTTNLSKLSPEQLAIGVNKGWSIN